MALSTAQKKGVAYLVSAALLGLAGGFLVITGTAPAWISTLSSLLAAGLAILGIPPIVKPS